MIPAQARALVRRFRTRSGGHLTDDRVVWIMGSPRTGSTWLVNLLGTILDAGVVDEPLIGTHLGTPDSAVTARPGEPDGGLLSDRFAGRPDYVFADAHADVWVPALRDLVLRRLAAGLPAGRDRGLVLVKEPNGSLGAPLLLRCLPGSRLLFLVRDGRDVVDSFLDGLDGGWMSDSFGIDLADYGGRRGVLASRARRWVQDTAAVQRAHDAHPPHLRTVARYEELLADPVGELAILVRWLGRPVDRERIDEVVERLDRDRVPAEHRGAGRFVRAATPGLWREHTDPDEQDLLEQIMGPTLRRLGYP